MPKAKKTKKIPAHVVLLVDESGSMAPSRETTVNAINDYVQGLKSSLPDDSLVTIVKFDSTWASPLSTTALGAGVAGTVIGDLNPSHHRVRISRLFDRVPLGEAREVKLGDYSPSGMTPLHDAVGRTLRDLDETIKARPGPVYFAILTDGGENTSVEFTLAGVRSMIEERVKQGWTVAFLGVDIDAYSAGGAFGIKSGDTVQLNRGKLNAGIATLAAGTARKYDTFGALGGNAQAYAAWNATDATFTNEDKKNLES